MRISGSVLCVCVCACVCVCVGGGVRGTEVCSLCVLRHNENCLFNSEHLQSITQSPSRIDSCCSHQPATSNGHMNDQSLLLTVIWPGICKEDQHSERGEMGGSSLSFIPSFMLMKWP